MRITQKQIEAAYKIAVRVFANKIKARAGALLLRDKHGMNLNSAHDFIGVYRRMREGTFRNRWLGASATEYYFRQIETTNGRPALSTAIRSTSHYIDHNPGRAWGKLRDVVERFSRPADERKYRDTTKRAAMKGLKAVQPHARRAIEVTVIDPVEARMQNELRQLLEAEHGKHAVQAEKDFIDIQVTIGARNVLIEIKSALEARRAIRQSLGQLVDYAYFNRPSANSELVIVGPGRIKRQESRFIATLTKRFQLPIRYIQYVPGSQRFKL